MKQDELDTCQFSINVLIKFSCLHGSFSCGIYGGIAMVEGMDETQEKLTTNNPL